MGAAEMFRAHELIAYDWLVLVREQRTPSLMHNVVFILRNRANSLSLHLPAQTPDNPYRRPCSDPAAQLEYVPLLPLHTVAAPLGSSADIGGPGNASFACSYASLVSDIERYVATRQPSARKAFAVAGTFNLRTELGVRGMASQLRRGPQYDQVTSFVTSTFLGHYERFPQCPDLLRKHWPGVLEMPYVAPSFFRPGVRAAPAAAERDVPFLFIGRLWLFGPERVCSVRNAIAELVKGPLSASVVVVNATAPHAGAPTPLSFAVLEMYSRAVFCLVAKGDSYSSAALFVALDAGCIPVLLSDWLVPAYNWDVPWSRIAVRVSEEDFLASPEKVCVVCCVCFHASELVRF